MQTLSIIPILSKIVFQKVWFPHQLLADVQTSLIDRQALAEPINENSAIPANVLGHSLDAPLFLG